MLTVAEELRQHDNLTPLQAVINAAKIRLRPRLMIALAIIFGFIPLALNLEEGGEMLQALVEPIRRQMVAKGWLSQGNFWMEWRCARWCRGNSLPTAGC